MPAPSRFGWRPCKPSCCPLPTAQNRIRSKCPPAARRTPASAPQLDERSEKVNLKIRDAQLQKIPYMLVVGDREQQSGHVAVRNRKLGDQGAQPSPISSPPFAS